MFEDRHELASCYDDYNLDFYTKRLHEKRVLYTWTSEEWIKSSWIFWGVERVETSCIMVETISKKSILIGKMLEATKRGIAWDLLLEKKIRRSACFCRMRTRITINSNKRIRIFSAEIFTIQVASLRSSNRKLWVQTILVHELSTAIYAFMENLLAENFNNCN